MIKLNDLSIADLKATIDYLENLKAERLSELKKEKFPSKDDEEYTSYDKLSFKLNRKMYLIIHELMNN